MCSTLSAVVHQIVKPAKLLMCEANEVGVGVRKIKITRVRVWGLDGVVAQEEAEKD